MKAWRVVDSPLWQIDGLITAVSGKLPLVVRLQTAIKKISALQKENHDDFRLLGELEGVLAEQGRLFNCQLPGLPGGRGDGIPTWIHPGFPAASSPMA